MRKLSIKEITQADTPALTSFIDYWKDYNVPTVLLAYAELKRRNYSLNEKLITRLNEFCAKNNITDFDSYLSATLKNIGYNHYDESNENEIDTTKKVAAQQESKIEIGSAFNDNDETKYPALRTISVIYKIFGGLLVISTLIVAFVLGQQSGIFALITIISGMLIVLGVFAVAESIMVFIDIERNTRIGKKNND